MSIPKVLHRVWLDEPVPERYEQYWQRFRELHPDWELLTWDDSSELTWMRNHDIFLDTKTPAGKADVVRYEVLARYGGVYVDTDMEPLRAMDPLLDTDKAFVAYENDELLCPTVIGAEADHPALRELLEQMPAWYERHRLQTPNFSTGPVFLTEQWRGREDVLRMPAIAFYPVGWWEKELLGEIDYPRESYAVHHWVKGWDASAKKGTKQVALRNTKPLDECRVVVLVPWRAGDAVRERSWNHVQGRISKALDWPIYTCDSGDGPWNRSRAINLAAQEAGEWDVAVVLDADTVDDFKAVTRAVELAHRNSSVVVPWNRRTKLSEKGTQLWMQDGRLLSNRVDIRDKTPGTLTPERRGGAVVVSRAAWDSVGGFDESFEGWGHEDAAFRIACDVIAPGGLQSIPGRCVHLWHERSRERSINRERLGSYQRARKNGTMPALLGRIDSTISVLIPFTDDGSRRPQFEWVRKYWERTLPQAEIIIGDDEGTPYSKTAAVNDAAMRASGDVLVVVDADAYLSKEYVMAAISIAAQTGALVVPWKKMTRLNAESSARAMAGDHPKKPGVLSGNPAPLTAGGMFVIARTSFEKVEGMDPRFRGWGYEDISFRRACDTLLGKTRYLSGELFCLEHPRTKKPKVGRVWGEQDRGKMNTVLNMLYMKAEGHRSKMQVLAEQHPLGGQATTASLPPTQSSYVGSVTIGGSRPSQPIRGVRK